MQQFTLTEAAALKKYGCRRTLSSAFNQGRLKGRRWGRVVSVTLDDLDAFLKVKGKKLSP